MKASILITTLNRKDELAKAVASALAQTACPEVIVIDDGSTDGTAAMVRCRFPGVLFHRVEVSQGYIVQRNRGVGMSEVEQRLPSALQLEKA